MPFLALQRHRKDSTLGAKISLCLALWLSKNNMNCRASGNGSSWVRILCAIVLSKKCFWLTPQANSYKLPGNKNQTIYARTKAKFFLAYLAPSEFCFSPMTCAILARWPQTEPVSSRISKQTGLMQNRFQPKPVWT